MGLDSPSTAITRNEHLLLIVVVVHKFVNFLFYFISRGRSFLVVSLCARMRVCKFFSMCLVTFFSYLNVGHLIPYGAGRRNGKKETSKMYFSIEISLLFVLAGRKLIMKNF